QLDAVGSAGSIAGSSYTNLDVKFSKGFTNPQGNVKITVTSSLNANTGLPDGKTHTYVIASSSITSLSATLPKVSIGATKVAVTELVTNADGTITAVSLDTNASLQLAMTDGAADTLAVTLIKSRGGLWFSSAWDGTKSVEKGIVSGNVIITP